jgi:hypothetical protein
MTNCSDFLFDNLIQQVVVLATIKARLNGKCFIDLFEVANVAIR